MGTDLLWTFVSRCAQPLHRQVLTMWMYPGPSCPNHPFSIVLNGTKISTQIRGILVQGGDQNSGPNPIPLREGDINPWVSLLELSFAYLC
jgi:hypothetical protein